MHITQLTQNTYSWLLLNYIMIVSQRISQSIFAMSKNDANYYHFSFQRMLDLTM